MLQLTAVSELTDVMSCEEYELTVCSDRFRRAADSAATSADNHSWFPVDVLSEDGEAPERYWLVHGDHPEAMTIWGLDPGRCGGRSVILAEAGDSDPAFSGEARRAIDEQCPGLGWRRV